jgi:hypothetical protein
MVKIGVSKIEITPPLGTWLIGCMSPSTGVNDPLMASTFLMEEKGESFAIISLDLVGLSYNMSSVIREVLARRCGINPKRVMMFCSHTHSAPFTIPYTMIGWMNFLENEKDWASKLPNLIADCIDNAKNNFFDANLSYARTFIQIGENRRLYDREDDKEVSMKPNKKGTVVPWSDILRIDDSRGEIRSVLYSQAAHPVIVHGSSSLISSDYPGYSNKQINKRLGNTVLPLFIQGCGADNNAPLRAGFNVCELVGKRLGDSIADACEKTKTVDFKSLDFKSSVFGIPLQPIEEKDLLEEVIIREENKISKSGIDDPWKWDNLFIARDKLRMIEERRVPRMMPMEISMLLFDNQLSILGMTHEVFGGYQLSIDKINPFRYMMIGAYCNFCENYIPTKEEMYKGGYEVNMAPLLYPYRLGLTCGTEKLILSKILELFKTLES